MNDDDEVNVVRMSLQPISCYSSSFMQVGYAAKDCEALSSPTTLTDVTEQHSHTCMITVISIHYIALRYLRTLRLTHSLR